MLESIHDASLKKRIFPFIWVSKSNDFNSDLLFGFFIETFFDFWKTTMSYCFLKLIQAVEDAYRTNWGAILEYI